MSGDAEPNITISYAPPPFPIHHKNNAFAFSLALLKRYLGAHIFAESIETNW